jgi:hypothetical protein
MKATDMVFRSRPHTAPDKVVDIILDVAKAAVS